ncbi:hypothetical protein V8F33_013343 [Rhypophila sp. PSN 637]
MYFTYLSAGLMVALSFVIPAAAAPQAGTNETVAVVPCDPIDKYTTSWFLGNVCKRPPAATCLFYTRGLSRAARIFSKSNGADMTTIWEMWATSLYNNRIVTSNPLRCIMQNKPLRRQYFAAMSESMAIMCDVFATVMDPNPVSPREDGIWGQTEFPTLKQSGNEGCVNSVAGTNPDGTEVHTIWTRPGIGCASAKKKMARRDALTVLQARQDSCGIENDDVAAQFDEGGEFEVEW